MRLAAFGLVSAGAALLARPSTDPAGAARPQAVFGE